MFLVTYEKRNGDLLYRKRMSIPGKIGSITSMGWKIKDIKQEFKGKYYSFCDYNFQLRKYQVINHYKIKVKRFFKRYSTTLALIVMIPLYLIK